MSRPTIARHGDAAGCCSILIERGCDIRDMPVQAPLRDEGAGEETGNENAERQTQQLMLDDQRNPAHHYGNDQDRD